MALQDLEDPAESFRFFFFLIGGFIPRGRGVEVCSKIRGANGAGGIKGAEADGLTAWTDGRACSRSDPGLKGGDKKLYSMKGIANGQTESEGH